MASTRIVVPDYEFSGTYYADLLRRLRLFNRVNAPEITSEVEEEPFIQGERSYALVGHYNNVLLDLVAQEGYVPTAHLQDSVRLLLRLIDYYIKDYSPATVELLLELSRVPGASEQLHEAAALFETRRTEDAEPVPFEVLEESYVGPSNVVDAAFGLELDRSGTDGETVLEDPTALQSTSMAVTVGDIGKEVEVEDSIYGNGGVFRLAAILASGAVSRVKLAGTLGNPDPLFAPETNLTWRIRAYTADGSTALNTAGAPDFTPWADPEAGDKLYVGSFWVLWTPLDLTFDTVGAGISGVWEYYDPDEEDENPDAVTDEGGFLRFDLSSLLGTPDRSGALVRARYLPTGISELLPSSFVGGKNVLDVTAFLGQTGTPSFDVADYVVGTDWNPLPELVDGTSDLSADGSVEYELPQGLRENWQPLEVNGSSGFFIRYRLVSVSTPTAPILDRAIIDGGSQYVLETGVQGRTVDTEDLRSSNGRPSQRFELGVSPGLRNTVRVWVDEGGGEVEWENLTALDERLLTSGSTDRHFVVDQDSRGVLTVAFGDGERGRVPPLGTDNIRFEYRVEAANDGNVGANTVVVNSDGGSLIASVTNPRPASGWKIAEGADEESLALVKEAGPASLRTGRTACAPDEYETLAVAWTNSRGSRPVVRAKAVEEGYGPKTIRLVVVGTNGVLISAEDKAELEEYFNGDPVTGEGGVGGANAEVTVDNFSPRLLGPTIAIEATAELTEALVITRLVAFLNPTALESDGKGGVKYVWRFGGRVPLSRISAEVFAISPGNVFDVDVLSPASDVELLEDELPFPDSGSFVITIVPPSA